MLEEKLATTENNLHNIEAFLNVKADLEAEKKMYMESWESEKKDKVRLLADKEREKVQATDKLKKEMLHKIQETKTTLLSLKKEQLQTTTRLTVLQNHQLTTELEYQSKQTEKLLFRNAKLQEQIAALKRDIEIHKQVEQEIAKRSHYSQKLIKKLSERVKELEAGESNVAAQEKEKNENSRIRGSVQSSFEKEKSREEMLGYLEKSLATAEKKNAKLQNVNMMYYEGL